MKLKRTCYELLWLNRGNGRKKISLFTRTDLSLSIKINFKKSRILHFSFVNRNFLFPRMLNKALEYTGPSHRVSVLEIWHNPKAPLLLTSLCCEFQDTIFISLNLGANVQERSWSEKGYVLECWIKRTLGIIFCQCLLCQHARYCNEQVQKHTKGTVDFLHI